MTYVDIAAQNDRPEEPDGRADLGALRRRLASSLAAMVGSGSAHLSDDLLRLGEWHKVRAGDRLFRQGGAGDSMYIVVSGRLVVLREDGSTGHRVVGEVWPGESVGEMGLLARQPRSATVEALRDSVVIRLSEEAYRQIVAEHPQVVASAARLMARRSKDVMGAAAARRRSRNIAIVPLRRSVRCAEFVKSLRRAMERRGTVLMWVRAPRSRSGAPGGRHPHRCGRRLEPGRHRGSHRRAGLGR
jgi:NTE family protein